MTDGDKVFSHILEVSINSMYIGFNYNRLLLFFDLILIHFKISIRHLNLSEKRALISQRSATRLCLLSRHSLHTSSHTFSHIRWPKYFWALREKKSDTDSYHYKGQVHLMELEMLDTSKPSPLVVNNITSVLNKLFF